MHSPPKHDVLALFSSPQVDPRDALRATEGVEVSADLDERPDVLDSVKVTHPHLGSFLLHIRNDAPPSEVRGLRTPENRLRDEHGHQVFSQAKTAIELRLEGPFDDPLADRKRALQIAAFVLHLRDDGLGLVDMSTQATWLLAELDDEVSHGEPIDPLGLVAIHAVANPDDPPEERWIHSHGLEEVGLFDLELHGCSDSFLREFGSFSRTLVEAIVEQNLVLDGEPIQISNLLPDLRAVSIDRILRDCPEILTSLYREDRDHHEGSRALLCDPQDRKRLLGLGKKRPRPYSAALEPMPEHLMFLRTTRSSERQAARARASLHTFKRMIDDNLTGSAMPLAKFGVPTEEHGSEHMWVRVDGWSETEARGELLNQPYHVPNLEAGARISWPLEWLSDWIYRTALGDVTPQWTGARFQLANAAAQQS